jgi:hypothetical protein
VLAGQLAELESMLRQSTAHHERLVELLDAQRVALRTADAQTMQQLAAEQAAVTQLLRQHERRRLDLVAAVGRTVRPAQPPTRLEPLAQLLGEPHGGRLLTLRAQLIERMKLVQSRGAAIREAAADLAKHVQGLVRTVGAASTRGAAYTAAQAAPPRPQRLTTLSMVA